jgi:AAA domain
MSGDPLRSDHYSIIPLRRKVISTTTVSDLSVADMSLHGATEGAEAATSAPRSIRRASSISAAEIEVKPVEWLWPGRVPMHALTVLAGDPGLGKSLLTIHLAAKLSQGELTGRPANVLMLTAEDPLGQVVRPRLEAAGADIRRVHFGSMMRDGVETPILLPDDVEALDSLVQERGARLVVIDPLMAHLAGGIDSWKDQKVRHALAPLHRMAERRATAVLVVAHLNKGQGTDPLQRLGGSIGIPAAARSVLLLGRDPDSPDGSRRVLAHVKSNVAAPVPSLAFALEAVRLPTSDIETVRIVDAGTSPYLATDLLSVERTQRGSKLAEAVAFLDEQLQEGPKPADELLVRAKQQRISHSTLKRAREERGVVSEKCGFSAGWIWFLPSSDDGEEAEAA